MSETNLMQRGFNDLLISEQANVLKIQHSKMFSQGKRNDIIAELKRLESGETSSPIGKKLDENISSTLEKKLDEKTSSPLGKKLNENISSTLEKKLNENTSSPLGKKLNGNTSLSKVGDEYGMSKNTVARLLRVNYLIQPFKDMIDTKIMALRVGVELSYISKDVQAMIYDIITTHNKRIDMKLSKAIRKLYNQDNSVTMETLKSLIVSEKQSKDTKPIKVPLSQEVYSQYFDKTTPLSEVADTLKKALEMYFKSLNE